MICYLHDDTVEGAFTCVYHMFKNKTRPDYVQKVYRSERNILDEYLMIDTDFKKSEYLFEITAERISTLAQDIIYNVALSYDDNSALKIFDYLREGFVQGRKIEFAYANDIVLEAWHMRDNVLMEYHRYMGFIRFNKIRGDIFFAEYNPKNNLNLLLAEHFKDRMKNEKWIICDRTRNKAIIYNGKDYMEVPFPKDKIVAADNTGINFDKLWKGFLNSITIQDRINYKLQLNNMPKRYRAFMKEME